MKKNTKQIMSLLSAAAVLAVSMPMTMASTTPNAADYYARNFVATNNGIFWEGCAQISWFNAAADPTKVALYASGPKQTDGSYVLISDTLDTEPNASVVTTLPTYNWRVTPRNAWYNFKLVSTFEDGTVTEQTLDYFVPDDTFESSWKYTTNVSDDFATIAQRGGWSYSQSNNGFDFFPMASEVVLEDGNPALKVWSNGHILSGTDETRDSKTNNSGNYYGHLKLQNAVEAGASYDISFRYKAKGIEYLRMQINNKQIDQEISDTQGEWVNYSTTINSATGESLLAFEFQAGNEEFIIDDVVIKKSGTDENILNDGDFSNLAASAPAPVTGAIKTVGSSAVTLRWTDSASADAVGANVYKTAADGSTVKVGYVRKSTQKLTVSGGDAAYTVKAVNANGAESDGVTFEFPQYTPDQIAAVNLVANDTHIPGKIEIAWNNANIDDIKSVALYNSDGTKIDDFDTAANAFCHTVVEGLNTDTFYTFKLVTTTAAGDVVEQLISGVQTPNTADETTGWGYTSDITDKLQVFRKQEGTQYGPTRPEVVTEGGNSYLKVLNAHSGSDHTYTHVRVPLSKLTLAPSTQYTVSFNIKGAAPTWAKCYTYNGADARFDYGSGKTEIFNEWTPKSGTITTSSNAQTRGIDIEINGTTNGIPVCIDDITVKDASGNVVYSEDFESNVNAYGGAPIMATAEPAVRSVTFNYTAPGMDDNTVKYVRAYVQTESGSYLAAIVDPMSDTVTINSLKPSTAYTFVFDIITEDGAVSSKQSISATTLDIPDYEVTAVKLMSGGSELSGDLAAGTYTAKATVANNSAGPDFAYQVIAVLYDGERFVSCAESAVTPVSVGEQQTASTAEITVPDTAGHNYNVKVFVWNSLQGMKPLCDVTPF